MNTVFKGNHVHIRKWDLKDYHEIGILNEYCIFYWKCLEKIMADIMLLD